MIAVESFSTPIAAANDNFIAMKLVHSPHSHVPVMLSEVLDYMQIRDGGIYVDATFGHGGYTRAILDTADCMVYALDRDPEAEERASDMMAEYDGRLRFIRGNFGDLELLLNRIGVEHVDGVCFDLGVASSQLDDSGRGFSFRHDGPLNMRMDGGRPNAADIIAAMDAEQLADIIENYGEEKMAARVARAIVEARKITPITTTSQLADVVRRVVPRSRDGLDPATRTFQALRIYVNDEMGELERGLIQAEKLLSVGGRLVTVAYHSLEDRMVKEFLKTRAGKTPNSSRHMPAVTPLHKPSFNLITRKSVAPSNEETITNPRASSAKLRAAERTSATVWPNFVGVKRNMLNS